MSLVDLSKYNGINPTDPPANARIYNASSTTPMDNTAYVNISPADLNKIRAMVHEEIAKALQEEEDEEEASPYPRVVRLTDKATMHVKFEYEGVLYAGQVYPVEEKHE